MWEAGGSQRSLHDYCRDQDNLLGHLDVAILHQDTCRVGELWVRHIDASELRLFAELPYPTFGPVPVPLCLLSVRHNLQK